MSVIVTDTGFTPVADTTNPGLADPGCRPMSGSPHAVGDRLQGWRGGTRLMTTSSPFALAACAEMLWRDHPIDWRASRLKEMGFGVGLWNWPDHDLAKLEATGANFTIMNGYLRGRLADDDGAAGDGGHVVSLWVRILPDCGTRST